MNKNAFNPKVSSIECHVLIRNDTWEKNNREHWLCLLCVCAYVYVSMRFCVHVCVDAFVYVYVHVYVCVYV